MHLLLTDPNEEIVLLDELRRSWPEVAARIEGPGRVLAETPGATLVDMPPPAFSRQLLPNVTKVGQSSIAAWAKAVCDSIVGALPDDQNWRLHIVTDYGALDPLAGRRRCELIRAAVQQHLKQRRRRLHKSLRDDQAPFTPADSLVQVLLTAPDAGWLSIASAPAPHALRKMIWPFPKGDVPLAVDTTAPSRAFAKLVEAEIRLGRRIGPGEKCVDLGAAPGSWSYVALERGAAVTAVDRAPLRADLMSHPRLQFIRGDAFAFTPRRRVDWLLCDVIAAPQRSIELLLHWLRERLTKGFVVTIKFKGRDDYAQLERLKSELPSLAREWFLVRLCANRNEVCAFGMA
jgi:23S rRNA (cytidine2498-2'-O)-methyltransferase